MDVDVEAVDHEPPSQRWAEDDWNEEEQAVEGQIPEGPSAEDLKEQWRLDQRLLAWVKSQGLDEDHPRRVQAERQVEESKKAWQSTAPRAAPSRRMQWAEEALLKAKKGAARMEQSIHELDTWYDEERATRQASLRELQAKVKSREEHLAEVTRQAAEDYSAETVADPRIGAGAALLHATVQSLGQEIGPALERLREVAP